MTNAKGNIDFSSYVAGTRSQTGPHGYLFPIPSTPDDAQTRTQTEAVNLSAPSLSAAEHGWMRDFLASVLSQKFVE
jgi:hypothetical protein